MKEFNENDAVSLMTAVLSPERRDEDAVTEVLDLIFDCYDDNGQLDLDDDSDDLEAEAIAAYVSEMLKKNPPAVHFTHNEVLAMVNAELNYEESLLD
ncbi:MAG: hypothetical protein K2F63_00490 [Muribaculaceae bacterium]|nr:hypothetical protein [Muribaculaceae bacterium]MDE6135634.1 hypothetical protein [Muribaculaceae bacterium]